MLSQKTTTKSIRSMTNLDKRFIITVGIFSMFTVIFLCSDTLNKVGWAIYSFGIKDFLIIALSMMFVGSDRKVSIVAIGLSCYLIVPTIIRSYCAIQANFNYLAYRNLLNNSEYSYFLLLVLFFIAMLIYNGFRNERKTR